VTEAISKLVDLIASAWRLFAFWAILDAEYSGFIRTLGRTGGAKVLWCLQPGRKMKPGWNWKCPVLESPVTEDARAYAYILDPQSLQTGDGVPLVLRLSVTVRVTNVKRYWMSVADGRSQVQDMAAGELGDVVASSDAAEVLSGEVLPTVLERVQKLARQWGMAVDSVKFVDAARTRSIRLWQSNFAAAGQD
jgi:regulator of protease activity HflC (stomatin/prohibitin superfamily)